jgi:hypothetical protein
VIEVGYLSTEVSNSSVQVGEQCKRAQYFLGCGLPPFQYHAEELLAFKMWHQPLANVPDSVNAGLGARYRPAFRAPACISANSKQVLSHADNDGNIFYVHN